MYSEKVNHALQSSNVVDYSYLYNYIIANKYPMMIMAGEFDMQDGAAGQVKWMRENLQLNESFWQ